MALTTEQKATLKAAINGTPELLAAFETQPSGSQDCADLLNSVALPSFKVWQTRAGVAAIFDAITWVNFTPSDAPDGTATHTNRLLAIQTKQMNLQNMLVGRDTINAALPALRAGLRDAVIQLPSGAGGALVSAGGASGAAVLNACTRDALLIEKILTAGVQTTGSVAADVMGYEGRVSYQDVDAAMV